MVELIRVKEETKTSSKTHKDKSFNKGKVKGKNYVKEDYKERKV